MHEEVKSICNLCAQSTLTVAITFKPEYDAYITPHAVQKQKTASLLTKLRDKKNSRRHVLRC